MRAVIVLLFFLWARVLFAQTMLSPARLTNVSDSYPMESPDGKQIVFQSNRTGNWEIYTMNADGSAIKQLTHNVSPDNTPCWSPDGKQIVFASERDGVENDSEVYIMNADGSDQRRLTNQIGDDSHPKFTPDGSRIIFNSARSTRDLKEEWSKQWIEIFTMDLRGGDVRQLTSFKTVSTFASISPDGRKIAYRKVINSPAINWDLSINKNNRNSEVFVMDIDGKNDINVSDNAAFDGWPSWSRDGRSVIFSSNRAGPASTGQLFMVDTDGKNLRQVSNGAGGFSQPAFSADGKKIYAYQSWEGQDYEYGNIVVFK